MAPRDGLEFEMIKMGRTGPPLEPRRRPQAGKSGDPRSQNTDMSTEVYWIHIISMCTLLVLLVAPW